MKKTILSKILGTNFMILISALLLAMLLMAILYGQVLLNQQRAILMDVSNEIDDLVGESGLLSDGFQNEVNRMGRLAHTKIYVLSFNEQSKEALMTSLQNAPLTPFIEDDLKLVLQGNEVYRSLQFSQFFSAYTVFLGRPLLAQNKVIGVILLFKPLSELPKGILLIGGVFFSIILGVLFLGFVLIKWSTKRITQPLLTLSQVAQHIATAQPIDDVLVYEDDEIGHLTTTFNLMKNRIEGYNQEKSAFMAMVSHDLKTPLMSINGYIEAMIDEIIPKEDHFTTLDKIHGEVMRLTRLTYELLRVSKTKNMSFIMKREVFDFVQVLQQSIDAIKQYEKKSIVFDVHLPNHLMVKADQDKIQQIIGNILSNSIKFSKETCNITIIGEVQEAYLLILRISDQGLGIENHDLGFVFEPEVRLNKEICGEGIGLTITKKLVEMHGGHIIVESEFGKWTRFTLQLPIVVGGRNG